MNTYHLYKISHCKQCIVGSTPDLLLAKNKQKQMMVCIIQICVFGDMVNISRKVHEYILNSKCCKNHISGCTDMLKICLKFLLNFYITDTFKVCDNCKLNVLHPILANLGRHKDDSIQFAALSQWVMQVVVSHIQTLQS